MTLIIFKKSRCVSLSAVFLFVVVQVTGKPQAAPHNVVAVPDVDGTFIEPGRSHGGMDIPFNVHDKGDLMPEHEVDERTREVDAQEGSPTQLLTNATLDAGNQQSFGTKQVICSDLDSGGTWCNDNYKCCSRGNNNYYCCPNNRICCSGGNCCSASGGSCSSGNNPCGNSYRCCTYGEGYTCCDRDKRCCAGKCCSDD